VFFSQLLSKNVQCVRLAAGRHTLKIVFTEVLFSIVALKTGSVV